MHPELVDVTPVAIALVRYVYAFLPLKITGEDAGVDPALQLQWIPVRMTGTLESVLALGAASHHEDAAALVRVMTDHLTMFAWLLADEHPPERINAWKNNDLRQMRALRAQISRLGVELPDLPPDVSAASAIVDMRNAATECDTFWTPYLRPLFRTGTLNSFAGLYAAVFRSTSPYVHPTLRGSRGFFATSISAPEQIWYLDRSFADLPGTYVKALLVHALTVWLVAARFRHADTPQLIPLVQEAARVAHKWNTRAIDESDASDGW
jgi:hypothetical protein